MINWLIGCDRKHCFIESKRKIMCLQRFSIFFVSHFVDKLFFVCRKVVKSSKVVVKSSESLLN